MTNTSTQELRKLELFADLPDEVLVELLDKMQAVSLKATQTLFHKGDPGEALFLLQEGRAKMVAPGADGQEVVLNEVGPGSVIGEMAILDQKPRSAGVVALSDASLLKLSSTDFLDVLNRHPELAVYLTRNAIDRLRFATTYIERSIEWSTRIADGDYAFVEEQIKGVQTDTPDAGSPDGQRANRFLGTFFEMVEGIRAREAELKSQLQQLKVEIDQAKRAQDVGEIADSEFFQKLKAEGRKLRGED
ncbi:MAG: cyclic nucleotide-binding domain-containing protein [Chloroflexi bacterium]|nr:MAG: cyclic nucleotide-binding domain-containing protein [Chloroflexota bacterium]MBL1195411.1 cyclic nucleotide-binding domain-containing protein [Chloroflexota bacterium]NOH12694.1 cyclic nucleotide-binding domain-containing protein [Chloroflexota bacterium]